MRGRSGVVASVLTAVVAAVVVARLRLTMPVTPALVVAGLGLAMSGVAACVVGTVPLVRRTVVGTVGTVPLVLPLPVGVALSPSVVPGLRLAVPDVVRAVIDADLRGVP